MKRNRNYKQWKQTHGIWILELSDIDLKITILLYISKTRSVIFQRTRRYGNELNIRFRNEEYGSKYENAVKDLAD